MQKPNRKLLINNRENNFPLEFSLHQNYPNPFNSETVISFTLPGKQKILLEIYNTLGKKVNTLVNEEKSSGLHKVVWNVNPTFISSGIYYLKLKTDVQKIIRKMIYLR